MENSGQVERNGAIRTCFNDLTRSLLNESNDTMDEDSRKNESKDKLLLQFDQELIYRSTYIAMYMLDNVCICLNMNFVKF